MSFHSLLFLFLKTFSFAFTDLFPGSFFFSRLRSPLSRVFGWVWTVTHCKNTEPSSVLVCCFLRSHRYCRSLDLSWASGHHPQEPSCQAGWAHEKWSAASWPCSQIHLHYFGSAPDPCFWAWINPARVP